MSPIRFLKGLVAKCRACSAQKKLLAAGQPEPGDLRREDWPRSMEAPTDFYIECFRYFHRKLPQPLREHRAYFQKNKRGFGEDAFHVMWFLLHREFAPKAFLEIGVYRGQTASLFSLLQKEAGAGGDVAGISPFEAVGDSVSKYMGGIDYKEDTLANFAHFGLKKPTLVKAWSTDAAALEFIRSRQWDCIYIDGNHDYEIARADWEVCAAQTAPGGLIVLDDSGIGTAYNAPPFATQGHPGPSRVAREIDRGRFKEILQVGHNRVFQKLG